MNNEIKWTDAQQSAIDRRDTDLLVSASAGSGKTTVMIERIAAMIIAGSVSVSEILVLTFTKASAADMKKKLRRRLEKEFRGHVDLQSAAIGTFHKFCGDLVRTYFNIAGVSPSFGILDDIHAESMKDEILEKVICAHFDDCAAAVETFCVNRKTDEIKKIILSISDFLSTRDDAQRWLEEVVLAGYEEDLDCNCAMETIICFYRSAGRSFQTKFSRFSGNAKLLPYIKECLDLAGHLAQVASYDDLHAFADVKLTALKPGTGKDNDGYQAFKEVREQFKKLIEKVSAHYCLPRDRMSEFQSRDREIIVQVIKLVRDYMAQYSDAKNEAEVLDFNDLEKYTCVVLRDEQVARYVREKYKYIFIDEYQDTNPMQEKILRFLAGEKNTFMVGDIKQSIYGFRGCEPTIFAGKMTDFDASLGGAVVRLNENFRSDPRILGFVNSVFSKIMTVDSAEIDYHGSSMFNVSSSVRDDREVVECVLVDGKSVVEAQSAIIASKILEYKEAGFSFGDIAILARSRTHFDVLGRVMRQRGISVVIAAEQDAGELFEIALLNNMLFAVSNFYNELPLALVMQSFVFGFSANDLASAKLSGGEEKLFLNLVKQDKFSSFVQFLYKYNALSKTCGVADVITTFLTEFAVIEKLLLLPEGQSMIDNIYTYINKLRTAPYAVTVAGFLYLLEHDLLEIKITPSVRAGEHVRLMTMHASKGLEFPVVIVFDVGASFNTQDNKRLLVIDKKCGLCVYSLDADEFTKTHSIARLGAVISGTRVMVAEEMRLLYVALTRAMKRLFIVGAGNLKSLSTECEDYDILCAKSFLQFLAPAVLPIAKIVDANEVQVVSHQTKGRILAGAYDKEFAGKLCGRFAYRYDFPTSVLIKNSVTSLTKREHGVADVVPFERVACDRGADYGTRFHKFMQDVVFGEKCQHDDRNVVRCVEIVSPLVSGMNVHREVPFLRTVLQDGESVIVQGVIDLLAVAGKRALIIDYKTTNASEEKLLQLYTPQLEMYAAAVQDAIGDCSLEVYIYSTAKERLIRVG